MDPQTKLKIQQAVLSILKNADMNAMTESKVRALASEKLGQDLSKSVYKKFVRKVLEDFLSSRNSDEEEEITAKHQHEQVPTRQHVQAEEEEEEADEEEEEEEEEEEQPPKKQKATVEDNGDILICKLSGQRSVTIQNFKGQKLVSIREYYTKDGKQLPGRKGISLTLEQWEKFKKSVPAIEEAIEKQK